MTHLLWLKKKKITDFATELRIIHKEFSHDSTILPARALLSKQLP